MRKSSGKRFIQGISKVSIALSILLSLQVSQAWAGQNQDCTAFGDASFICAPVTQIAQTLADGTPVPVSNGSAFLPTSANSLKFIFTSNSANAGKNLFLAFFDISSGLALGLPSDKCAAPQMADHACIAKLDSNGSITIPVSVSGISPGKYFKYQLNGPAGFTSGYVTTTFTSSGGGGNTPEVCGGDSSTICAPSTRLSGTSGGKAIAVSYSTSTGDGTSIISPNTNSVTYNFSFPSDYMNKYVFVQFFDVTTLSLTVPGGSINSSTSCDPQPAATKGCKIQIDGDGKASFTVFLSNASLGSNFKYIIAGPNYASHVVQTTVAVPPSMSVVAGKAKMTVKINNANGRIAIVTYKVGKKQKIATLRIISDTAQFNISAIKGAYLVKVSVGRYSLSKKIAVK